MGMISLQVRVEELEKSTVALQAALGAMTERLAEIEAGLFTRRPLTSRGRARALLRDVLADGPRLVSECIELGAQHGIHERTMRFAHVDIGARPVRLPIPGRGRCWHWELPER